MAAGHTKERREGKESNKKIKGGIRGEEAKSNNNNNNKKGKRKGRLCARAPAGGRAPSTPGSREARPGAHPPPALVRLRAGVGAGREGAPGALASRSAPRVRRAAGGSGCRRAGESACQPLGRSSRWPSLSPAFGAGAVEPAPRVPRWGRSGDGGSEVSEPERERPCGGHGRPSPRPQPGRHRPVGPAGERRPQPRPPRPRPPPQLAPHGPRPLQLLGASSVPTLCCPPPHLSATPTLLLGSKSPPFCAFEGHL